MGKSALLSILVFISSFVSAEPLDLGCVPKTTKSYPAMGVVASGLTERQYNAVMSLIEDHYSDEISLYGAELVVNRDWRNSEPNAFADRPWWASHEWHITVAGGLARNPYMTTDALLLVACHELGHHVGGAPKVRHYYSDWASTEGQSDYFATLKCMRRVLKDQDNVSLVAGMEVPELLQNYCKAQWGDEAQTAICIRSIQAGMDLARVFADLRYRETGIRNEAGFELINASVVSSSVNYHPRTQCRFDTYRAGAFCPVAYSDRVSQRDPLVGTCHEDAGHTQLTWRPSCWYAAGD